MNKKQHKRVICASESDTHACAKALAKSACQEDAFLLQGPLGAGKTTFCRQFIQTLIPQATCVPSPTFTIANTYTSKTLSVIHMDLYRIQSHHEIQVLDLAQNAEAAIFLIEWPGVIINTPYLKGKNVFFVDISISGDKRIIDIASI